MVIGFHGCIGSGIVGVRVRCCCGLSIPSSGTVLAVGIVVIVDFRDAFSGVARFWRECQKYSRLEKLVCNFCGWWSTDLVGKRWKERLPLLERM